MTIQVRRLMVGAAVLLGLVSGLKAQSSDALSGRFSIRSNGEQVVFSRGNLCLQIENSAWYFAAHQYDIIGTLNIFGGALSTPIDLYGYSGSTYYNWGVSPVNANSLFGGDFVDWGENAIGDSPAGFWRTLSYTEWDYLLNQRTNAAALRGVATVGQQTGLVLLPDTATSTIPATYTTDEWAAAEANGAVFLPFAGRRIRANRVDSINTRGYYWTSTTFSADYAGLVNLGTTGVSLEQSERMHGHSVRLIHSIGIQRDSIYRISVGSDCSCSDIPDTKAEALTFLLSADGCPNQRSYLFAYRDQVILTAVAEECKEFVAWSDGNTENPRTIRLTGSMTLSATFRDLKYRVSYVNYDGSPLLQDSVFCGETPTLPTIIPTREATAEYTYTFVGWTPELDTVKGDQIYTAQYDSTINRYPVDFVDYNGTLLLSDTLDYGTTPAYTGTTLPSRESTVAYEYSFSGWTPAFAPVVGPQTYTAVYDSVSLLYQVTFLDYDGTVLLTGSYDYGETPAYSGATLPSREATAEYTYTFIGWTSAFAPVTEDQTYTALYDSVVNRYRIEYLDYDGTLLFFDTLAYGMRPAYQGAEPQREATAEYTYTFVGWTPELDTVKGNQVYTATYDSTINRYPVDFVDYNGTLLLSDTLDYGTTPAFTGTTLPSRESTVAYEYSFSGWTPAFAPVVGPQTYTAVYDSVSLLYQVTFLDYDGTVLLTGSYDYGETPAYTGATLPSREATTEYTYTFIGWTPAFAPVTEDQTYTALYDSVVNRYRIEYLDYDGTLLFFDTLAYGMRPAYQGTEPQRAATAEFTYAFTGWTPSAVPVTSAQTYTAQYDSIVNRYQVRYFDYDGALLLTDSVSYGIVPSYQGTTPSREATAQYTYSFVAWTPAFDTVHADQAYTAVYDSVINRYQVTYSDFDGTLLMIDSVAYDLVPVYQGNTPMREATAQYTYTFAAWTPALDTVRGDQYYTATYDSVLNRYEIIFEDYDEAKLQTDMLDYGTLPAFTNILPPREGTAEYTYVFTGWTPSIDFVTGPQTYTAQYDSTINRYQVTYLDFDSTRLAADSVAYGETPAYSGTLPSRTATAQYTYTFTGWTPLYEPVTGDQAYTAVYDSVINRYQIDFRDFEGTLLLSDSLDYGLMPAYAGSALPTREATVQYTYSFAGWTPAIDTVTGDQTYTAQYDSTINRYEVRYYDYDSTLILTDSVAYGVMPVYPGTTPQREATAEYTYVFVTWTPALDFVSGDQAYMAVYDSTLNRYQVTYRDFDGTQLRVDSLSYGDMPAYTGATPARTATAQYTYTFTGWTPALDFVVADQTYTAQYDSVVNRYEVRFVNYDGTLLQADTIAYGTRPAYTGSTPTRATTEAYSYTFRTWTPAITPVTGAQTYTATYDSTAVLYAIRFLNYDSTVLYQRQLSYGTLPVYSGRTPTRPATAEFTYTFTGWFPTLTEVTGDQDYIATFHGTRNRYEVIFRDYDGTTLLTDSVEYGQTPAYTGATPTRDANAQYTYTFTGWTPALAATTANAVYTALYDSIVNQYSITFLNYDLTVLQVSNVDYGTMPMYQGSEPQKAATQQWTYHFVDWTPELTLVTEAATYTAVFDSTINRYTLTLTGDNATLIGAGTYDYGTVVSVEAVADEGYHFVEWSDGEWRNPREVTVLDHMSLTALIELDCVGLNSVPVEKIYEWLLLVNVTGLEQLGYTVTEDDVTWYRAIGEVDDPEHKDDDELVGRGFYLKVGASYAGFGRFYAVVDVSGSMHVGDNLCTGLIRSQVVPVGLTDVDETAVAWAPYLYPAALHPYETLTVHGLRPNQATRIRVYDVAGHMLHEERTERGESEAILTAPAIAGTYLVELNSDSEQVVLRFIVLQ